MTEPLPPGLYEGLVTEALAERLAGIEGRLVARTDGLRSAEVADRVALHLSRVVERAIDGVGDEERFGVAIAVARDLFARLDELVAAGCAFGSMTRTWPSEGRSECGPSAVPHRRRGHFPEPVLAS